MRDLKVFSKKLNETILFHANGLKLVEAGTGSNIAFSWQNDGWNNDSYDSWRNHGWGNNSYSNWSNHGWNNNSYDSWQNKGWNNSSGWSDHGTSGDGCYITTACLQQSGKTDDCYELETMRFFRDAVCAEDEEVRSMALDYYRIAPMIVKAINASPDKDEIYEDIRNNTISECVRLIEAGERDAAIACYVSGVNKLRERFGI